MYEIIKARYNKGYIRTDQLKRYCNLSVITPAEYKDICGKDYEAE